MHAELLDRTVAPATPQQEWLAHCLTSAKKFLKNAVVIDNEPFIKTPVTAERLDYSLQAPDDGMGMGVEITALPEASSSADQIAEFHNPHKLDVRKVSDAFAEIGLACAFVLPDDEGFDEEGVVRRVLNSALISDIVVIDWYLYDNSPSLTKRILKEIAENDVAENGRLRFICVYTGQPLINEVGADVRDSLGRGGVYVEQVEEGLYFSKSHSCLVTVLNKQAVLPADLPSQLVSSFAKFADGLMPSFALAAVGAIRKNIHHMVTRFGADLDSAYVANRLITNPPEDVAEMMRELLVAECDNALGLESIADHFLDRVAVEKWINNNEDRFSPQSYTAKKQVDRTLVSLLLRNGIDDKGTKDDKGEPVSFPVEFRNRVSIALAGDEARSRQAEFDFSRLVVFKREAFGDTKLSGAEGWLPSLTTGTLLQSQEGESKRYFVCLTPACDTLRLLKETPFVFLEAAVDNNYYSVVFKDDAGECQGLYFREKHPTLITFSFVPNEGAQRVRGEPHKPDGGKPFFTFSNVSGSHRFTWLGEIRYTRAASEMAKLAGNWMRIGISDSEHLRLTEAKKFK